MDGTGTEHSDSDSGESWILLEQEHSPAYADDAPDFSEKLNEGNTAEFNEKDEDTDGISIISDSDNDSTPCEIINDNILELENRPKEQNPQYISVNLPPNNDCKHYESIRHEDDLLGDTHGKTKTYVHRRNKRLSTVLNIIMLGSVITAAGVAIGHMWGVRDDCLMHNTPSVNKILSNLYKLQEENAYLRNKLKELTLYSNIMQMQQQKADTPRKYRCKKVFEESLTNSNAERITKCVDSQNNNGNKLFVNQMMDIEYEKDFLNDIKKLKDVYKQNRSWLDDEINKRMKYEQGNVKAIKTRQELKQIRNKQLDIGSVMAPTQENPKTIESNTANISANNTAYVSAKEKKITYADSLKLEQEIKRVRKREINEPNKSDYHPKKKPKEQYDVVSENSFAEELKKDDRHIRHKQRIERKKQDRQKLHKKQKRKNKYEQWEMKGGYLKYYDDISASSSQDNFKNPVKNNLSKEFELNNHMKQFSAIGNNTKSLEEIVIKQKSKQEIGNVVHWFDKRAMLREEARKRDIDLEDNWYDKMALLRKEARKKLEKELFGEISPNNAGWYFRRMERREQCRTKGDKNNRKLKNRKMNYKTRH